MQTAVPGSPFDLSLPINPLPPKQNLRLRIDNITHRILTTLAPQAQDLVEIASYVYYADCSVSRGTEADVYGDAWRRTFHFVIPVSDPNRWNDPALRDPLTEMLEFVSGDHFSFTFVPPNPKAEQLHFWSPKASPPFPGSDSICLFSGGLDSLIGSLLLLKEEGVRPLLVSHRSMSKIDSQQKRLAEMMRVRNPEWQFPHLSIWINRMGNQAQEVTQRTRSFLFLSLAAATAFQLGIQKISICENGVVSLNIPISGQTVGTLLTRSTHPTFLKQFQDFMRQIVEAEISVTNPFLFKTKTEMIKMLRTWSQADLMGGTISCSYTQGKTRLQPQCGTCFQCVNRRFSVIAAGEEAHDPVEYYEKDLFTHPLEEGRETAYAEGYVRTAYEIAQLNDRQLFAKYPELQDVEPPEDLSADQCGEELYDLFQRHAEEVIGVAEAKLTQHRRDLLAGKLPGNCLVSMLASRHHLLNPLHAYAGKIAEILSRALRIAFQTEKPKKEARLHESAQAALAAAEERLQRESPMLSYSVVQTKPDFADVRDLNRLLFLEFKLLNSRSKLNRIVKEITSCITIYRDQGAYALFVVYDTRDFIVDEEEFVRDFEKHDGIKAMVVR
jgi:7-cyano-7-deazaguanine synthase in queuosine biosynthesis